MTMPAITGPPMRAMARMMSCRAAAASSAAAMMKKPGFTAARLRISWSTVIACLPAGGVVIVLPAAHGAAERPAGENGGCKRDEAEYTEEARQAYEAGEPFASDEDNFQADHHRAGRRHHRHEEPEEEGRTHPREQENRERMLAGLAQTH